MADTGTCSAVSLVPGSDSQDECLSPVSMHCYYYRSRGAQFCCMFCKLLMHGDVAVQEQSRRGSVVGDAAEDTGAALAD